MRSITIVDTTGETDGFKGQTFETLGHAKATLEDQIAPEYQADFRIVSEPCAPGCPRDGACPEHGKDRPGQTVSDYVFYTEVPATPPSPPAEKPPLVTGCFDYFPNALAAIAAHAEYGNAKHNPGEPLHWAFGKSTHHAESIARHLFARGTIDPETGKSHTIALCMRSLMLLETELIAAGATPGRGVR